MREKSPSTMRVMTWNIHGALGGNPRFDLAGVVALIQRWDADVVALQEVDSRRQAAGNPFAICRTRSAATASGQNRSPRRTAITVRC